MRTADISKLEQQAEWLVDDDWLEFNCGAKCSNCGAEAEYNDIHGDVITPFCAWCGKKMSNFAQLVKMQGE